MNESKAIWNYDLIMESKAMMVTVDGSMMRVLKNRSVELGVKDHMVQLLRAAADNLDKMEVGD